MGDMFALSFNDGSSIAAIIQWHLERMRSSTYRGAPSFDRRWSIRNDVLGSIPNLGLLPYFLKIIEHSPQSHGWRAWNRATPVGRESLRGCWKRQGFIFLNVAKSP